MEQADEDLALLTRMRVLHLDRTDRAKMLLGRARYYEQRQHDDCDREYDGRQRDSGASYFALRQRQLGYTTVPDAACPVPLSRRRPLCPTTTGGTIVDTYTAMLVGNGCQPKINVSADDESTDLLAAMFESAHVWDALAEARKVAGAEGAAALLPEIIDGALSVRVIRPEDLYIEWASKADWIPRIAIEQRRIEVEDLGDHGIERRVMWHTRAWDQTRSYIYEDVDEDHGERQPNEGPAQRADHDDVIELDEAPVEHRAGRCPVIWLQNTRNSSGPIGDADYESVYEQIDQLDHVVSMIVRCTKANTDPTLVVGDKMIERRMWAQRAKGYGQKIEVSEVGKVSLLEASGKTVETSWLTAHEIERMIVERTGVVPVRPDQAGAFQSGVALQILRGTLDSRVADRRPPLTRALAQLCRVLLELARAHGIKDVGAEGEGIELPQREIAGENEGDEPRFELPRPGTGNAIVVTWGPMHAPTPTDLQVISQAATLATGGKAVVSQETAVTMFSSLAQTDVEPNVELARIKAEDERKVASFESSMTPTADRELDDLIDKPDGADPTAAPTGTGVDKKADEALNGAQVQALQALLAQAGVELAPKVVERLQTRAFQIPPDEAAANVADQVAFLKTKPAPEMAAPAPKPPAAPPLPA